MTVDYIVSSLPGLQFDAPAPLTWERFAALCGEDLPDLEHGVWKDLETQLKNAIACARGGEKFIRKVAGCSVYWKNRVVAAFAEKDIMKRETMIDRVFWDAAEELTSVTSPLGRGALATYAIRLKIALRRGRISGENGIAAFNQAIENGTKMEFQKNRGEK